MIRPLLPDMTKSELHAVMTGGFATIAGSVLAAYILFGVRIRCNLRVLNVLNLISMEIKGVYFISLFNYNRCTTAIHNVNDSYKGQNTFSFAGTNCAAIRGQITHSLNLHPYMYITYRTRETQQKRQSRQYSSRLQ